MLLSQHIMLPRHIVANSLGHVQAPISVYTSGKGSSAAGLTATVVKDNSGEFFLEVQPCLHSPHASCS